MDVKANFGFGPPKLLFQGASAGGVCLGQYGVAANGQKFLVIEPAHSPVDNGRMHVVTHWDAALPH